jgi:hypothetical protein
MADPRAPTRADLAKFLPDQRSIRAFEKLFELVPDGFNSLIEEAFVASGNALAAANATSDSLVRIADAIELLAKQPAKENEDQIRVSYVDFNTSPSVATKNGRVWWSESENCLNVCLKDNVVLQVGFEQYMRTENDTGATISNGTVVGFAGVNGEIKINKYIADGSVSSIYFIGLTTNDMPNGDIGETTTFGKVRGIDTSSWPVGTILYASPTTAGALTSTRPSAPDVVIPVATVLVQDATNGELFVRPTIPPGYDYASYTSTTDQTLAAADTAYPVEFDTTEVESGISLVSNSQLTVSQSGLYLITVSYQVTSSNSSSSTFYAWMAKNGTDVARSRLDFTVKANGDTKVVSASYQISLAAGDYIELMWAGDTVNLTLDEIPATAFAPEAPSAIVTMTQIQF